MKRNWTADEQLEHFTILENEMALVSNFNQSGKLGFMAMLKFFQMEARFPTSKDEIPLAILEFLAKQLRIDPEKFDGYVFEGRSFKRHKAVIRNHFGYVPSSAESYQMVSDILGTQVQWHDRKKVRADVVSCFRKIKVELPSTGRMERLVDSLVHSGEQAFYTETGDKLSSLTKERLDRLVRSMVGTSDVAGPDFNSLRSDPGRIGLESFFKEIDKLVTIRELKIPDSLFATTPVAILEKYRLRVASELLGEIREHPDNIRHTLLSIFFWTRQREVTDNLVELLIQVVHKISSNA